MGTETKVAAQDVQAQTGQQAQGQLYGATKETIEKSAQAGYDVATKAGAVPQAVKDAAAVQKAAAQEAKLGYGTAFESAKGATQAAFAQAHGAIGQKHRSALVAARQALAEAATRGLQRGRTTAGNLGAAGTLGKQAATTQSQMASQQAAEEGQLGLAQAQTMSGYDIAAAEKAAATGQAIAGYDAAGIKEAAAAELGSAEAFQNAVLGEAETEGTLHQITQDVLDNAQTQLEQTLTEIAAAVQGGDYQDGIVIAAGTMDAYSVPMDAVQKVQFISIFNQSMLGHPDSGPNTGLWTATQAYALAEALGAGEALRQMSRVSQWLTMFADASGTPINLTPNTFGMIVNKMISEGKTIDELPGLMAVYNEDGTPGGIYWEGEAPEGAVPMTQSAAWAEAPAAPNGSGQ